MSKRVSETKAQAFLIGMLASYSMVCLVAQDHVSSRIRK